MTLDELIARVSKAYDVDDTVMLHHQGEECIGDGLAEFISNEIKETYIEEASTEDQVNEAWRVMVSAAHQLNSVVIAIENIKTREIHTKAISPEDVELLRQQKERFGGTDEEDSSGEEGSKT